ncbi:hypothetical protein JYU34_009885 [Plutella xylostella]|uniref:Uncharacterized protein n=1 Tax=Plutella xylostella TaxID=51655 RepID=A0ABQ7QKK7_PLUXY|nr:hypothetical protein JYU34_009885 [Plutella xylostella]
MVTWRKVLLFSVFIREIICYDDSVLYLTESTLSHSFEQFMNNLDDTVYRQKKLRRRLDYLRATRRPRVTSVAVDKKELQLVKPLLADVLMMKLVEYYEGKLRVPAETTTSLLALATATEPDYSDVLSSAGDLNHRDESLIIL